MRRVFTAFCLAAVVFLAPIRALGSGPTPVALMGPTTEEDTGPKSSLAETLTIESTTNVGSVSLYLRKQGTPGGTLTLTLYSDEHDQPEAAIDTATATTSESGLSTDYTFVPFTFAAPISLSVGRYWLVLTTDRSTTTDYVEWGADPVGSTMLYQIGVWLSEAKRGIYEISTVEGTAEPPTPAAYSVDVDLPSGAKGRVNLSTDAGQIVTVALMVYVCLHVTFIAWSTTRNNDNR